MVLGYEVIVGSLQFLREEDVEHSHNSTFVNMAIAAQENGSIVVFVAVNGSMRAMIQLADKPRPEAAATVAALQSMGMMTFTRYHAMWYELPVISMLPCVGCHQAKKCGL